MQKLNKYEKMLGICLAVILWVSAYNLINTMDENRRDADSIAFPINVVGMGSAIFIMYIALSCRLVYNIPKKYCNGCLELSRDGTHQDPENCSCECHI